MQFDPYRDWLGLSVGSRPPHPYALLGLPVYERDVERITAAAAERARQIRRLATFDRVAESRQLLNEVRTAAAILTDPDRRRRLELQMRRGAKSATHEFPRRSPAVDEDSIAAAARPEWLLTGAAGLLAMVFASGVVWSIWQFRDGGDSQQALARHAAEIAEDDVNQPVRPLAKNMAGEQEAVPPMQPQGGVANADRAVADQQIVPAAFPLPPLPALPEPKRMTPRVAAERPPVVAAVPVLSKSDWQAASHPEPPPWSPVEARRPTLPSLASYHFPTFVSHDEAAAYALHLEQLLETRTGSRDNSGDLAQRHYRDAVASAGDSTLADYALGLVHLQKLRLDDASARFDASRGSADNAFLPGWQAFIQLELRRNRRDAVLENAVAFAEALAMTDGDVDRIRARDASIRWLGRLTAVLEAPWDVEILPPQDLVDADAAIREVLGPSLTESYEAGRRSLRDDVAVRAEETRQGIEQIASDHGEQQTQELSSIAAEREAAQNRQAELDRLAAEARQEFQEQTGKVDADLGRLRPQHDLLAQQVQSAQSMLVLIDARIAQELQLPPGDRPPIADYGSSQLLAARQRAQAQYQQAADQFAKVRRQVDLLSTQRQQVVDRYEREARLLAAEREALKKRDEMLDRRAAKTGNIEASDLPAIQGYQRRLRDTASYLPFDADEEVRKVLAVVRGVAQQSRS